MKQIINFENFIKNLINNQNERLYCLIDGAQINHSIVKDISQTYGPCYFLLSNTFEDEAQRYGAILIDFMRVDGKQLNNIIELMNVSDSLIYFHSQIPAKQLINSLLEKLYIELEDGGIGIVRYYDPRVLMRLHGILNQEQKLEFMKDIDSYYFTLNKMGYEINYNEA